MCVAFDVAVHMSAHVSVNCPGECPAQHMLAYCRQTSHCCMLLLMLMQTAPGQGAVCCSTPALGSSATQHMQAPTSHPGHHLPWYPPAAPAQHQVVLGSQQARTDQQQQQQAQQTCRPLLPQHLCLQAGPVTSCNLPPRMTQQLLLLPGSVGQHPGAALISRWSLALGLLTPQEG